MWGWAKILMGWTAEIAVLAMFGTMIAVWSGYVGHILL